MIRVLISISANVQHYTGVGYQYFLRKNWVNGNTARLQISRALLERFVARKGRVNSVGIPHLEVLSQGAGWYLIASDKPENDGVVMRFLTVLNRWVLKQASALAAPVQRRSHYFVQVPKHEHPQTPDRFQIQPIRTRESEAPAPAPTYRLQALVSTVNARFGH